MVFFLYQTAEKESRGAVARLKTVFSSLEGQAKERMRVRSLREVELPVKKTAEAPKRICRRNKRKRGLPNWTSKLRARRTYDDRCTTL